MGVVKVLERKAVIRAFGTALFLSPFCNTLASMALRHTKGPRWTFDIFWQLITSGAIPDHALYLASLVIGLIMLSGSSSAWRFVLILLGGHIFRQVFQLGENFRIHWIYGVFFVVNVVIFLFIADQLVWKQNSPVRPQAPLKPEAQLPIATAAPLQSQKPLPTHTPAAQSIAVPVSTPAPVSAPAPVSPSAPKTAASTSAPAHQKTHKRILIHFAGVGNWAQLMSVNNKGILVRKISEPPPDLDSREIEINIKKGLTLRTRLARQTQQDYFFEYTRLTTNEIQLLNQWLQQLAA